MTVDVDRIDAGSRDRVHTTKHVSPQRGYRIASNLLDIPRLIVIHGVPSIAASRSFLEQPVVDHDDVEPGATTARHSLNRVDVRISGIVVGPAGVTHLLVGEVALEHGSDVLDMLFAAFFVGFGAMRPAFCGCEAHQPGKAQEGFAEKHFGGRAVGALVGKDGELRLGN